MKHHHDFQHTLLSIHRHAIRRPRGFQNVPIRRGLLLRAPLSLNETRATRLARRLDELLDSELHREAPKCVSDEFLDEEKVNMRLGGKWIENGVSEPFPFMESTPPNPHQPNNIGSRPRSGVTWRNRYFLSAFTTTPDHRVSRSRRRLGTMVDVNAVMDKIGVWHIPVFILVVLRSLPVAFNILLLSFAAPSKQDHWCARPENFTEVYSVDEWKILAIPHIDGEYSRLVRGGSRPLASYSSILSMWIEYEKHG